jgi:hypothetical protein
LQGNEDISDNNKFRRYLELRLVTKSIKVEGGLKIIKDQDANIAYQSLTWLEECNKVSETFLNFIFTFSVKKKKM